MSPRSLRSLVASVAVVAALFAIGPSGAAATTTPAVGYEQFAGCPHPGLNPLITTCSRSTVSSGSLQMGNLNLSLKPMVLSGGTTATGDFSFGPKGGLQQVELKVPGGVVALTGLTWLVEYLGGEELATSAVIELAGMPSDPLASPVTMPIKIHLINPVLGESCYLGTVAEPIVLHLTTGTTSPPAPNKPITGSAGTSATTGLTGITDVTGATHVDNSFVGRGANGCELTLFGFPPESIDSLIDAEMGLPSAAGTNMTIQKFSSEDAAASLVYP